MWTFSYFSLGKPLTRPCLESSLMGPKFKWDNLRCHNQDLVLEALEKRQIKEDFNISSSERKLANKVDELRVMSGLVLEATRVQVPEYDLYDLRWTREDDGEFETVDLLCA
ncbi:hypothetical protein Tco_0156403 [Tanacetum coccineum]